MKLNNNLILEIVYEIYTEIIFRTIPYKIKNLRNILKFTIKKIKTLLIFQKIEQNIVNIFKYL